MGEECRGCGIVAKDVHPMVAIMKDEASQRMFSAPVCDECWKDPEHRTKDMLKAHFHYRAEGPGGLEASNRMLEASKRGEHQGIGR